MDLIKLTYDLSRLPKQYFSASGNFVFCSFLMKWFSSSDKLTNKSVRWLAYFWSSLVTPFKCTELHNKCSSPLHLSHSILLQMRDTYWHSELMHILSILFLLSQISPSGCLTLNRPRISSSCSSVFLSSSIFIELIIFIFIELFNW